MKIFFVVLIIVLIALQARFWIGEGSMADVVRLRSEITDQQEENERLVSRNKILSAEVRALKSGTEGIEKRAREDMGMIKEGETFYMIVEDDK